MKKVICAILVLIFLGIYFVFEGGKFIFLFNPIAILSALTSFVLISVASFNINDIRMTFSDAFSKKIANDRKEKYEIGVEILAGISNILRCISIIFFILYMSLGFENLSGDTVEVINSLSTAIMVPFYLYLIKVLLLLPMENALKIKIIESDKSVNNN